MDSLTHIAIGAAAGEALAGKKAGYRAAVWGASIATLPDLDILVNPFVDSVNELYFHRNITHSFFFAIAAAPILGLLIQKIHKQLEVGWKKWSLFSFLIILAHILIDIPTTYGTQALQPFSNYPLTTDSMFIIDPLFTLPVLAGLTTVLVMKRSPIGRRINYSGLAFAALYIFWGLSIKAHVHSVFQQSFQNQFGYFEGIKTNPNGPTTFLWNGYIKKGDAIYQSVYSIFDESADLQFKKIPRNSHLIEQFEDDRAYNALMWFSRGYYTVEKTEDDEIILYDLRFGRDDLWLTDHGGYVWGNKLIIDEQGSAYTFELSLPSFDVRLQNLQIFWNRIWGEKTIPH